MLSTELFFKAKTKSASLKLSLKIFNITVASSEPLMVVDLSLSYNDDSNSSSSINNNNYDDKYYYYYYHYHQQLTETDWIIKTAAHIQ